jgi:hypothetical protein
MFLSSWSVVGSYILSVNIGLGTKRGFRPCRREESDQPDEVGIKEPNYNVFN